jgi:hypothetical protein
MVADNYMSDFPAPVDENSNLSLGLKRDTRNLAGKFSTNNLG